MPGRFSCSCRTREMDGSGIQRSFSVIVVFSASGWEMMAKVRRRAASLAMDIPTPDSGVITLERARSTELASEIARVLSGRRCQRWDGSSAGSGLWSLLLPSACLERGLPLLRALLRGAHSLQTEPRQLGVLLHPSHCGRPPESRSARPFGPLEPRARVAAGALLEEQHDKEAVDFAAAGSTEIHGRSRSNDSQLRSRHLRAGCRHQRHSSGERCALKSVRAPDGVLNDFGERVSFLAQSAWPFEKTSLPWNRASVGRPWRLWRWQRPNSRRSGCS